MIVQRNQNADNRRNDRAHDLVKNASANFAALEYNLIVAAGRGGSSIRD